MTDALNKAKAYSLRKYLIAVIDTAYTLVLLFLFLGLSLSKTLAQQLALVTGNSYFVIPAYIFIVFLLHYLLSLPLHFYQSFILEHKFCLSAEKIRDWFADQFKAGLISYFVTLIVLGAFYLALARFPRFWWLVLSLFWIFFSLILARLAPVIIVPLFFKYKRLSDEALRQRIIDLAKKMQINILDVFEIDFSKKTLKANAALMGWGAARRVILADTLKDKYSVEEIEVVLAHEFAHYRLKHLIKLVLMNSAVIIISFYFLFKTGSFLLNLFGLSSFSDVAALPLVAIYLMSFGIILQPLENYISRRMERNADAEALKITGLKEAFISLMDKLAAQNLANRNPHPLIKFYFFDHPPIDERIAIAKKG